MSTNSWWRVLYEDAGGAGHFDTVAAPSKEAAAWSVAVEFEGNKSALVEVQAIDHPTPVVS